MARLVTPTCGNTAQEVGVSFAVRQVVVAGAETGRVRRADI